MLSARRGDPAARERLAADSLPLVYNVVGRALNGHGDVDDVVQETMLRALDGLPGLRDASRFRSWLIAIAMNQIRNRWALRQSQAVSLAEAERLPDPTLDFAELTILRLGLSGQRREAAEATRWLDDSDQEALALWWLEAAGMLTRAELAAALGLSTRHTAVRVQRLKEQLDSARVVVRALRVEARCSGLASLIATWDGAPRPLWRKRLARHVRGCDQCGDGVKGAVPLEGLLAGIGLVVPLYAGTALWETVREAARQGQSQAAGAVLPYTAGAVTLAAAVTVALLMWPSPRESVTAPPAEPTRTAAPPPRTAAPAARPLPSARAEVEFSPPPPSRPSAPPSAATPPQRRLVEQVNALRKRNGCAELIVDARLTGVAERHAADMAAHRRVDHTDSAGRDTAERVRGAGYAWSAVGETLVHGPRNPEAAVDRWMRESGQNPQFVNCAYRHVGVGRVESPSGPYWAQVLATPS
ncbi:sigma-70 family RNA polymerase sigma factor [Streptomyces sp. VB1]|uniref:sigma-70 family RNA polymerase sigma factor n=1 Tax=Streptomyces sp. VB1 TaxID=2986803 RepID=UPI002ADDD0A1|nr:sigma-70 family RNA polymerase sigma factor [Streptomyces sp. VB1]